MLARPVISIFGFLILVVGISMLTAVALAYGYDEYDAPYLLTSSVITIITGLVLFFGFRVRERGELHPREGFVIVSLAWVLIPLFGCMPFLFSQAIPSFTDAYFETVSGFTTTGSSILTNVEKLPHGLLYWRSLTHWLGGMGIIVLSLAILPLLGTGGMQLFKAEAAGPTKDKLTPRIAETARLLWGIYVLATAMEVILLVFGGMPLFDAVCHSFATIASGGFSTKNASIGFYNSAYIDAVVTLFMFIAGTNFALHYALLKGNFKAHFRNDEFRFYLVTYVLACVIVTAAIAGPSFSGDVVKAFRYAAFNIMSIMTCTGFSTADFALWVPVAQIILLFLLFPGGCAGSTAGGMKNIRVMLLLRSATNELKKLIHPKLVVPVRYGGKAVEQEILFAVGGFIIMYLATFSISAVLLTITGLDIVTSMSAVATCMAGCGPGLGAVGPMSNFAHLSVFGKWVLDACMLLGRLEIYSIFVIFSSSFWKR